MLSLTIVEFLMRIIPEGFLFVWGTYVFSNKTIERNPYFISSLLLAIATYLVRMLPIQFGVHTIIIIIIGVLTTTSINKINTMKSISSSMLNIIMLSACESINLFILEWLGFNIKKIIDNSITKVVYFIPSLLLFAVLILLLRILIKSLEKRENRKCI